MVSPSGETIGEILRNAREAKKLTIEEINRETKISPERIRALETDDIESFESETYLKGFLKNYSKFLGLDPEEMWTALNRKRGSVPDGKGTFWDIEEAVREEKLKSPRIFRRFVLPAMVIIIVILALLFIRERNRVKALTTGALTTHITERG